MDDGPAGGNAYIAESKVYWPGGEYHEDDAFGALSVREALVAIDEIEAGYDLEYASDESQVGNDVELLEEAIGGTLDHRGEFGDDPKDGPDCRLETTLLVTDGSFKPPAALSDEEATSFPDDYVPFRQRSNPVHVLDVGVGTTETTGWLTELASTTGGSYSYVPTADDLAAWISEVVPYDYDPPVSDTTDSDDDGIPDNTETGGVIATMNVHGKKTERFTSDPHDSDTDDDGLLDGEEYGEPITSDQAGRPITESTLSYSLISDPTEDDGDWDGALDVEEVELKMNPLVSDPDFDSVWDGDELAWGTYPFLSDSDGDNFSDYFEITYLDTGFDPTLFDEQYSDWQMAQDMASGFLCGDYCWNESMGWLIGSLSSGYLVFGDLRDLVSQVTNGQAISAGFTLIGIVPLVGDIVKTLKSIAKFCNRITSPRLTAAAMHMGGELGDANPVAYLKLIEDVHPGLVSKLQNVGVVKADTMRWLVESMGADHVALLVKHAQTTTKIVDVDAPILIGSSRAIGAAGEEYIRKTLGVSPAKKRRTYTNPPSEYRYYDIIDHTEADDVFREVKVGQPPFRGLTKVQVERDDDSIRLGREVVWSFVASGVTNKIGPSPELLDALIARGIPFEIHWPK